MVRTRLCPKGEQAAGKINKSPAKRITTTSKWSALPIGSPTHQLKGNWTTCTNRCKSLPYHMDTSIAPPQLDNLHVPPPSSFVKFHLSLMVLDEPALRLHLTAKEPTFDGIMAMASCSSTSNFGEGCCQLEI